MEWARWLWYRLKHHVTWWSGGYYGHPSTWVEWQAGCKPGGRCPPVKHRPKVYFHNQPGELEICRHNPVGMEYCLGVMTPGASLRLAPPGVRMAACTACVRWPGKAYGFAVFWSGYVQVWLGRRSFGFGVPGWEMRHDESL